ncbi:MAG: 50S ribosomal protein L10 [Myxococcota bacterium]
MRQIIRLRRNIDNGSVFLICSWVGQVIIVDRVQKQKQVEDLRQIGQESECLVLSSVEGVDAAQMATLRRDLHEAGCFMKVCKNRLARIAFQGSDLESLSQDFTQSTALVWSTQDAVAAAKVLVKSAKKIKPLTIKSGYSSNARLNVDEIKALASLPSLPQLRAQILGLMQAVPSKLLAQVQAPSTHLVSVLQAKVDKDSQGEKE